MNEKKLKGLLKREENPKLDFKLKLDLSTESGKKELAKDICAMANTRGGRGYIVVGVEDKTKRIVGIQYGDLKEESIQQIVSSRCEPPIPVILDFVPYGGKILGVITILNGDQEPYQVRDNGAFYIRRGSTSDVMRKEEIVTALAYSLTLNPELCPVPRADIKHLDMDLIKKYFKLQGFYEISDAAMESLMINSGIAVLDKDSLQMIPTMGALLVFSSYNNIYLPQNQIKIVLKDEEEDKIIIIKGKLLDMVEETDAYLRSVMPSDYPIRAITEGLKNAVMYRDYTLYDKVICINISKNFVEVISPGCLNKKKGWQRDSYIKRNMWMYEKLIVLDEEKKFLDTGRGFDIMKKSFEGKHNKVMFFNSKKYNYFRILYPGIESYREL